MGDLNYRLNTTYTEMTNVKEQAIPMIPNYDQLTISRKQGNFPLYEEPKIDFLPSYKMEKGRLEYVNKKNQAPSYCDRVLYRNNSCLEITEDYYRCLDTVYGSDHRPVALCFTVKDFFKTGNF